MKFGKDQLTQCGVKKRLNYDPDTGVFTRKATKWGSAKEGRVAGSRDKDGYTTVSIGQVRLGAHRLAWLYVYGNLPDGFIDHKNGDPSDNRIDNLRVVDVMKNSWNSRTACTNKSGYRGVSWHSPSKQWQAQLTFNKVNQHLGYFNTREEAAHAYEELALRLRGEHHRRQKITHHPEPHHPIPKKHAFRNAVHPFGGYPSKIEYKKALALAISDGL